MQRVLVVRHAAAEPQEEAPDGTDQGRRLTAKGQHAMGEVAAGLRRVLDALPLIAHSPLTRAAQTAAILEAAYPRAACCQLTALAPGHGDGQALFAWLAEAGTQPVALVGHEPDLGRWVGRALSGEPRSCVELKKAAACLLVFPEAPAAGQAYLSGHFPPRILRDLSEVTR